MAKLCIYTCITGEYDNLNEIKNPEKNVDYYCFTNNKKIKSKTWKIVHIDNGNLDNCRLARKIKTVGHSIINDYDIAVWTDANIIWEKSVSDFVSKYLKDKPLAVFRHSIRTNVHDEAVACFQLHKDSKEIITKTINYLNSEGFPDDVGLCESTVFIKRPGDPKVIKTMQIWFTTIKNFSRRDQLSFNYAAWKSNINFKYIEMNVWDNPWFSATKHLPKRNIDYCYVYYGNPDKSFDISKYYDYKYTIKSSEYSFTTTIPENCTEIELNPINVIGTIFDNLIIKPSPSKIQINGDLKHKNANIFCTNRNIIRIYGNFKKGQIFSFSISLQDINRESFDQILENAWKEHNTLEYLKGENTILQKQVEGLENAYNDILNSRSWRALDKLRKVKQIFKKPS